MKKGRSRWAGCKRGPRMRARCMRGCRTPFHSCNASLQQSPGTARPIRVTRPFQSFSSSGGSLSDRPSFSESEQESVFTAPPSSELHHHVIIQQAEAAARLQPEPAAPGLSLQRLPRSLHRLLLAGRVHQLAGLVPLAGWPRNCEPRSRLGVLPVCLDDNVEEGHAAACCARATS